MSDSGGGYYDNGGYNGGYNGGGGGAPPNGKELYRDALIQLSEAITADENGNCSLAVSYYISSAESFLSATRLDSDESRKLQYREKVKDFLSRAETLKNMLRGIPSPAAAWRPQSKPSASSSVPPNKSRVLIDLGFEAAEQAVDNDKLHKYATAFKCYRKAADFFLQASRAKDLDLQRANFLRTQAKEHLDRAEELKTILDHPERALRAPTPSQPAAPSPAPATPQPRRASSPPRSPMASMRNAVPADLDERAVLAHSGRVNGHVFPFWPPKDPELEHEPWATQGCVEEAIHIN